MFKTTVEGELREHESIEETIDYIECKVCFEVDALALEYDLMHMDEDETLALRDDCMIYRITV